MNLLFKISYGLYVLSASADGKDNACMINTFAQQTASPERFSVTVNKGNYTTELIEKSGVCTVSVLSKETKFDTIKNFGMRSGKNADKFAGVNAVSAANGTKVPTDGVLGYFECKVEKTIDFGTHVMFVLSLTNFVVMNDGEALTYDYYQSDIKPKPEIKKDTAAEKWVCRICGYVHEGPLPADFICPICKHPASDFERIQ